MHKKFFRETSRFFNFSLRGFKEGYLLPVVLILGLVLTSVGTFGLAVITNNSTNVSNQIYNQVANDASQAGLVAAQTCLGSSSSTAADSNFSNVSMLMKTAGTSGQNKTFVDSGPYGATVSSYGNPTQGSFGPNSSSSSVRINVNENAQESVYVSDSRMAINTSDFTVEAWVYLNSNTGTVATSRWQASQYNNYWLMGVSNGKPYFLTRGNTGDANGNGFYTDLGATSNTTTMSTGRWYHMAGVRQSGVLKLYLDGQLLQITQNDNNVNLVETAVSVGFFNYSGYTRGFNGFVSNFRLVDGTAVYTSNFTPPTSVSDISNTKLILNMKNAKIYDASRKNNLRTIGNVAASGTQSKFDGDAVYFDGSSYLIPRDISAFTFGTGDFTIEGWIYPTTITGADRIIYDSRPLNTQGAYPVIYITSGGALSYWVNTANQITGSILSTNTWYHFAISKSSNQTKLFINGVQAGSTYTDSNNYLNGTTDRPRIGSNGNSDDSNKFIGYMDEVRVTKGAARYTANFTAPTYVFPTSGSSSGTLWTTALTPAADCTGSVTGSTKSAYVLNDTARKITSTYTVTADTPDANGATVLISKGTVSVNGTIVATKYSRKKVTGVTGSGTSVATPTGPLSVEYLVVAGGGAGGTVGHSNYGGGGGGGGGGVLSGTMTSPATGTTYALTVGAGGVGANGANSVFATYTAIGGGKGGGSNQAGATGGSGGGGYSLTGAGVGTAGQGNSGGSGSPNPGYYPGGGGGGAGAVGGVPIASGLGATGGNGVLSTITGSSVYYGGGGGGGGGNDYPVTGGNGGSGGGGKGAGTNGTTAVAGTANTGGGGGAGSGGGPVYPNQVVTVTNSGAAGGSGVVILKIPSNYTATFSSGVVYSLSTAVSGYHVYTITSAGASATVTFSSSSGA